MKQLKYQQAFPLECGEVLSELDIAYCTYGTLNQKKDNVVWVCHALTANADAADWWHGLVGEGLLINPKEYFIVCANMLGSCYGSTSPASINSKTGKAYHKDFPLISIRDMVRSHQILQKHLGIEKIKLCIGGSMGGQQVLEWAIMDNNCFDNICVLASNARHSPWAIAFNETQRMALLADPSIYDNTTEAGKAGLGAARAVGMLSYRHYSTYEQTQLEPKNDKIDHFLASSYQRYQGLKLWNRFDPLAYLSLSKSMDTHNVGRNRGSITKALRQIKANTLIIGIQTDILFPVVEQIYLADSIPNAQLVIIDSIYGHDGFLTEFKVISEKVGHFLNGKIAHKRMTVRPGKPGTESF